jgi:hypothetical protein
VEQGQAIAMGLNARFMADPRFREVKVLGYRAQGTRLWSRDFFQVAGAVCNTNDWITVRNLVLALEPPGKLDNQVVIRRAVQPAPSAVKNPAPTKQPMAKGPARISTSKK